MAGKCMRLLVQMYQAAQLCNVGAGKIKLGVQRLGLWDTSGLLGSTAGTETGAVLSMWRPDEGWGERDAFIVANAKLGTSDSTHHIYEHLDVMVHPLGVHLTEVMGRNFWVRLICTLPPIPMHGTLGTRDRMHGHNPVLSPGM